MFKQKLTGAVLALTAAIAAAGAVAGGIPASAAQKQLNANAEKSTAVSLSTENASLFLPGSYEQYLELENPSDIAVCDRYIAIAEGSGIYILDRKENSPSYRIYDHAADHSGAQISKIQFSDNLELYFSDTLLGFYRLDLSDPGSPKTEGGSLTSLTTFYIDGETVFEVTVVDTGTTYFSAPLSAPREQTQFGSGDDKATPQLGCSNGKLYSAVGPLVTVYSAAEGNKQYSATGSLTLQPGLSGLKSIGVLDDTLFYTVSGSPNVADGLYAYDLSSQTYALAVEGDGFGALTSYNGKLYAVKGNSVLEYSPEDGVKKTDYEISSASASQNRLSGAQDSVRAGNLLVTADSGNRRLSIYNFAEGAYSVLPLSYAPSHAATDGEIIAACSGSTVYVYAWNNRAKSYECVFTYDTEYAVSGLSCLYGKCYFVTIGFCYGVIGPDAQGKYALEGTQIRAALGQNAPAALTNDLYGNLYAVLSDGSVFRYTEQNFTDGNVAQGERTEHTLPEKFAAVRADFEGNLYCLCENTLYRNGTPLSAIDGKNFVFGKDGAAVSPISYALGFEDDAVYFNFGNYIVKSDEGTLGFPTLRTIGAGGAFEEIGRVHAPDEVKFTDVQKGAVGIEVDLATLDSDAQYFPFTSYSRTAEDARGVLLAEQGGFRLVALYHDREYEIRLFRGEQCTEAAVSPMERGEEKYLSSNCNLYHFPCIADACTETLPRGTKVKVLAAVCPDGGGEREPDLGYDFAFVEAETKTREAVRGYVPLSFLTDADPSHGENEDFEIGKLKKDTVFTDGNGNEKTLAAGTEVRLYANEDGTFTARYTGEDGETYFRTLTEEMIERGESDALRIALIVILSVLALVIVGAYFALLPHGKKNKNHS